MQLVGYPGQRKVVIGMVHLPPLPGTPFHAAESSEQALNRAVSSAKALEEGGASGCLVQTADRVYSRRTEDDPARVAAMSLIVAAIRRETGSSFLVGVQMMWNAAKASLAVAKVAGASFVRVNALVGMTLTVHGMAEADPYEVMSYRRSIEAWDVQVVADIHTMHFRWFGGERSVAEAARAARQVGADAVAVCDPADERTLALVGEVRRANPELPIILGGNTNHENAARLLQAADGAFVGTCLERGGWGGEIDVDLVRKYVDIVDRVSG
jgi:membrane complex biogenesis BtpA family protein